MYRILTINPGSTSTKVAVYHEELEIYKESFEHSIHELSQFKKITDQFDFRRGVVTEALSRNNIALESLSAVVGRGGMLPPVLPGGYIVNEAMKDCLMNNPQLEHASNLGALIAAAIAEPLGIPAYIYDAVVSDEMLDIARITGFPEIERHSFCHVLNSRATARKAAERHGKRYEDMNFVVAHMGGGISMSAHCRGRMIDTVSDDAGSFSPDRSGSVNLMYLVDLCYSGKYTRNEIMRKIRGEGGMKAYLGTHDCREIERRILDGDTRAKLIYEAQGLQIAKGIGIMLGCFEEPIDEVILTGGLAYSKMLTDMIVKRISHLVKIEIMPGENEMEALALGGLRILKGEEFAREFSN